VTITIVEADFTAQLWLWDARSAQSWTFVTLPESISDAIADLVRPGPRTGFGSVRVRVTVGSMTWSTSVFPDSKRGAYVLPIKKAVRTSAGIKVGDEVGVHLEVPAG
jgi:hypothetical protein